jgi:hypothetical protein
LRPCEVANTVPITRSTMKIVIRLSTRSHTPAQNLFGNDMDSLL